MRERIRGWEGPLFLLFPVPLFERKAASYPSDRIQSTSPRRRIPSRISASLIREYPSKKPVREGLGGHRAEVLEPTPC